MRSPGQPRKRRTREHVIADLSVNHVERFVLESGHVVDEFTNDYGFDLVMTTFDEGGNVEPDSFLIQMKASESWAEIGDDIPFDLDVRDYHLWIRVDAPVILILYDASRRKAFWVCIQTFFRESGRRPRVGAKTVRVLVPRKQTITRRGVATIRALKGGRMRLIWED